jgi:RNA polymerase sigma-70 factor (ECF subfamily)
LAYLEGVGIAPSQSVEVNTAPDATPLPEAIHEPSHDRLPDPLPDLLLEELWQESGASAYGLKREEFSEILDRVGAARNFGLAEGAIPSPQQRAGFFRGLRLADLVLARACANGHEGAWEHFLAAYQQPLIRAAIAITGSESRGRDLEGQLYAELYGLTAREGVRRSPLDSYKGTGSLLGWLRTTLAQRHVDQLRRTRRELPLDDAPEGTEPPAAAPESSRPPAELLALAKATEMALERQRAEERFLLAAYYLDGRTLLEIARLLKVHEATVSRRLRRVTDGLRKQIVRNLQDLGMSKQAARDALGADPRDLDLNLTKILQISPPDTFQEKAAQ